MKLEQAFKSGKALIPYIMAGDPDLDFTESLIPALEEAGADIIEVGLPFSDPLADGPVIQAAGQRALKSGTTTEKIFGMLARLKGKVKTPLVLMGYYNPILQYGAKRFLEAAKESSASGVLVPDLPFDEGEDFYESARLEGISPIYMVTPNTPEERLGEIGRRACGFLYCVSLLGITGDARGPKSGVEEYLKRVRRYSQAPLALGFGIDSPEKVKAVLRYADGIVVGSALVSLIAKSPSRDGAIRSAKTFVSSLKAAATEKVGV